jgi:hypothetical protein
MRAALYHLCRYFGWALFGILILLVIPVLIELRSDGTRLHWDIVLLFAIPIGGMLLVVPRALVGAVTGWRPPAADLAMAIWVGRFFIGWLVGLGIALFLLLFFPGISSGRRLSGGGSVAILGWDWFAPVSMFVGGLSVIVTGWLAHRTTRYLLPIAWVVVFALLLSGWLAANDYLLRQARHIFRSFDLPF